METFAKHLAIAAVSSVVWLAPAALAQDPANDLPSIRVSYADLDVNSDVGMQSLTRRVRNAVRQVCDGSYPGTNNVERHRAISACQRTARTDAWAQFDRNQERARARTLIAATRNGSRNY